MQALRNSRRYQRNQYNQNTMNTPLVEKQPTLLLRSNPRPGFTLIELLVVIAPKFFEP
jgi:type II secretory pathway pseudopilin PulG